MKVKEHQALYAASRAIQTLTPKPALDWFREGYLKGYDDCKREILSKLKYDQGQCFGIDLVGEAQHEK